MRDCVCVWRSADVLCLSLLGWLLAGSLSACGPLEPCRVRAALGTARHCSCQVGLAHRARVVAQARHMPTHPMNSVDRAMPEPSLQYRASSRLGRHDPFSPALLTSLPFSPTHLSPLHMVAAMPPPILLASTNLVTVGEVYVILSTSSPNSLHQIASPPLKLCPPPNPSRDGGHPPTKTDL